MLARAFDPSYKDFDLRGSGYYADGAARMAELDRLIAEGWGETEPRNILSGHKRTTTKHNARGKWNTERIVRALVDRMRAGKPCRALDLIRDGQSGLRIAIRRYVGWKRAFEMAREMAGTR